MKNRSWSLWPFASVPRTRWRPSGIDVQILHCSPPCPSEHQPRPESGDPDQVFSGVQRRILDQLQVGRDRQALEELKAVVGLQGVLVVAGGAEAGAVRAAPVEKARLMKSVQGFTSP
jgi:hypothetical protein